MPHNPRYRQQRRSRDAGETKGAAPGPSKDKSASWSVVAAGIAPKASLSIEFAGVLTGLACSGNRGKNRMLRR